MRQCGISEECVCVCVCVCVKVHLTESCLRRESTILPSVIPHQPCVSAECVSEEKMRKDKYAHSQQTIMVWSSAGPHVAH